VEETGEFGDQELNHSEGQAESWITSAGTAGAPANYLFRESLSNRTLQSRPAVLTRRLGTIVVIRCD
jgi:hypothetical protein